MTRQNRKVPHIKLMDEKWITTDVSVAGNVPKGEDLSEFLRSMLLLYPDLGLGLVSVHTVYLSPFCNSVLKTVLKFSVSGLTTGGDRNTLSGSRRGNSPVRATQEVLREKKPKESMVNSSWSLRRV